MTLYPRCEEALLKVKSCMDESKMVEKMLFDACRMERDVFDKCMMEEFEKRRMESLRKSKERKARWEKANRELNED